MVSRRTFLQAGAGFSFVSLAGGVPRMLADAAEAAAVADKNDHVLVVVELAGGNDGLNTVIPFENALYYQNRPTLGIGKDEVVKLSDQLGLHPRMTPLAELFREGGAAIVQGVGYPQPDRSHFRSMEIWHTASTAARPPAAGWLGRFLDETIGTDTEQLAGLTMTGSLPQALRAERVTVPVVEQLQAFAADAGASLQDKLLRTLSTAPGADKPIEFVRGQAATVYRTAERLKEAAARYRSTIEYPDTPIAVQLRQAAEIIAADLGARILFASQDGYDTHADQGETQAELLGQLADALSAFARDVKQQKMSPRVVVLVFSEFGRRVDENASRGTDHGAANCVFLVGEPVKGGFHGSYPSLAELGDGDLIYSTDFRSVYATLLSDWLGSSAERVLAGEFPKLDLLA